MSGMALHSIISAMSSLMSVGCQVLLLVVVMGAVRRHRPDAWRGLLAWAIGALVVSVVTPLLYMMTSFFADRFGGLSSAYMAMSVVTTLLALVHVALVLLLARGLVRLAVPPKPVVVDSGVVYR